MAKAKGRVGKPRKSVLNAPASAQRTAAGRSRAAPTKNPPARVTPDAPPRTSAPVLPVRAKDVKALKACPACGSAALAPTQSTRRRTVQRIVAVVALAIPILGPNGKQCLDCGWRVE